MTNTCALVLISCCFVSAACQSEDSEPQFPATTGTSGAAGASAMAGGAGISSTAGMASSVAGGGQGTAGAAPSTGGAGAATIGGAGASATAGAAGTNGGSGGTTAGAGGSGTSGAAGLPTIEECKSQPSVDRFTQWVASGEGLTEPKTGSILVKQGEDYVAKVHFVGAEWHVIPVYIANKYGDTADLTKANGITLTYSATSELHVQLRSESHWSGGAQYATTIPSTNGQKQTKFFSFASENWKSLFDAPAISYADTLKEGMGLVFVGNSENDVVFYGMYVDGWTPPCN